MLRSGVILETFRGHTHIEATHTAFAYITCHDYHLAANI